MLKRDSLNKYWLIGLATVSLIIIIFFLFLGSSKENTDIVDISPYALLDTSDVKSQVKRSVEADNPELLSQQIQRVVDTAKKMPLSKDNIAFLKSEKARQYLIFHAKRSVFDDKLTERFESLQPISDLKTLYPQAQDKFDQADKMIEKRDILFSQIKNNLIASGLTSQQAEIEAKKRWLQRFNQ